MKSIALYYSKNRISGSLFSADSHIVPATTIQSAVVVEVEQSRMKIAAATRQTVNNTMPVPYKEGGEKAATDTELHLNVWKVETGNFFLNPAVYIDFGIMFPKSYKTLCLFLPFDIDGSPQDLSDILRANDQTLGAVFNADIQVTSRVNDNYCTVSFINEDRSFYLYKLGETNFTTDSFTDTPKGTFIKITINSEPEDETCGQIYVRFRVRLKDKSQYVKSEHITNDLLQAAFSMTDLYDVRVNETRVLDSKVKETMKLAQLEMCKFDKVHMFYMVDTRETVHNGSSLKQDTRILESEQWDKYQPKTSLHNTTFVAYHWKKRRKTDKDDDKKFDEKPISSFSVFFSSIYPRLYWGRMLAYVAVAILLSWVGSMLSFKFCDIVMSVDDAGFWKSWLKPAISIILLIFVFAYLIVTKIGMTKSKIYRKR